MTRIILSDDQLQAIQQATDAVAVCDRSGVLVGYVTRRAVATHEEIAEARRRLDSDGPWHTTADVLSRLRALEQ